MTPIERATSILGGRRALAASLGVTRQAVSHWFRGRRALTAEQCAAIERATGGQVTRAELRPDIFGPAPEPAKAA